MNNAIKSRDIKVIDIIWRKRVPPAQYRIEAERAGRWGFCFTWPATAKEAMDLGGGRLWKMSCGYMNDCPSDICLNCGKEAWLQRSYFSLEAGLRTHISS